MVFFIAGITMFLAIAVSLIFVDEKTDTALRTIPENQFSSRSSFSYQLEYKRAIERFAFVSTDGNLVVLDLNEDSGERLSNVLFDCDVDAAVLFGDEIIAACYWDSRIFTTIGLTPVELTRLPCLPFLSNITDLHVVQSSTLIASGRCGLLTLDLGTNQAWASRDSRGWAYAVYEYKSKIFVTYPWENQIKIFSSPGLELMETITVPQPYRCHHSIDKMVCTSLNTSLLIQLSVENNEVGLELLPFDVHEEGSYFNDVSILEQFGFLVTNRDAGSVFTINEEGELISELSFDEDVSPALIEEFGDNFVISNTSGELLYISVDENLRISQRDESSLLNLGLRDLVP